MNDPELCEHENWEVNENDHIGHARCFDCCRQVNLAILFDNLRKRMEKALAKCEKELK